MALWMKEKESQILRCHNSSSLLYTTFSVTWANTSEAIGKPCRCNQGLEWVHSETGRVFTWGWHHHWGRQAQEVQLEGLCGCQCGMKRTRNWQQSGHWRSDTPVHCDRNWILPPTNLVALEDLRSACVRVPPASTWTSNLNLGETDGKIVLFETTWFVALCSGAPRKWIQIYY